MQSKALTSNAVWTKLKQNVFALLLTDTEKIKPPPPCDN